MGIIRIIIGGDVCPVGTIQNAFIEGKADQIFHDLLEEIVIADISVVNLECPLVSLETPIAKAGPILSANIKCVNGFVAAKWDALNLANNHSFDHGARGLQETISMIEGAGLSVFGAGENIKKAQIPFVKEINGERIVIYSMAEHEFSIADEKTAGANPLDLINFVNAIHQHKQQGIFIVLIHGGKEHYPYPSPDMVRRCRFMVDMGADAVICCHTHCSLPWEIYKDRPIVYGLGNLIFEPLKKVGNIWHEGYLARLLIEDKRIHFDAIPYFQSQTVPGVHKMNAANQMRFFDEMLKKSAELKNNVLLEDKWIQYCKEQKKTYMATLFGHNRLMRKFSSILFKTLYSKEDVLRALLLVQCETHQEILNTILRDERRKGLNEMP